MTGLLVGVSFVIGLLTLASIVRVVIGPTVIDRVLASSYAAVNSVILLMLIGFVFERPELFVDIGLAYALLAFLFPLAFARWLEPDPDPEHHDEGEVTS